MNIGIVDYIIIIFLLFGALVGFKEGAIKKITSIVGLVAIVVVSFMFKNQLSVMFYENLPFFNLWGAFKGIQVMNVIFYELLAFLIISSLLAIVYRVLLGITGIIEKVLKATIILSIPSKLIGLVIGTVENYIWIYVILFILTLPVINIKEVKQSQFANFMLDNTPVLSEYTKAPVKLYGEISDIVKNRKDKSNEQLNEESMSLMLDYDIITYSSAEKLIDKNKVEVNDKSFLEKYK